MDFRAALSLEVAFERRLIRAWHDIADPTYSKIEEALADKNFETARFLVYDLDMTEVGTQNREYIKYMLLSFAIWGAGNVTDTPSFTATGIHDEVLNRITDLTLAYLEHNGTTDMRKAALQSIAELESKVQKAEKVHKFGNTQINIPTDSEAHDHIEKLRAKIDDKHLMADGKDIGHNHVTVRYGLQDQNVGDLKKYIRTLIPFKAKLGKVRLFPPSVYSDGAVPAVLDIHAPELHQINADIEAHGNFKESNFKDYIPHTTLAYLKPEEADQYKDLDGEGKEFLVDSLAISAQDGSVENVPFGPQVQKADSYLKPLTSFAEGGNDQLKLISSLNSSRMATWGFIAECDVVQETAYKLSVILDGRTSDFCRHVAAENRTFRVEDARQLVNKALSVTDPNDLRTIQPWPKQDAASIAKYKEMTNEELVALGLQIPPFHPRCRTHLVRIGRELRTSQPVFTPIANAIPAQISTEDTFKELGLSPTEAQVSHWNSYLHVSPVEVLSNLAGTSPQELLDGSIKAALDFMKNGDIKATASLLTKSGQMTTAFTYDPYTGRMFLDEASFDGKESLATISSRVGDLLKIAGSVGAAAFLIDAEPGELVPLGGAGFSPTPLLWQHLRQDALGALESEQKAFWDSLTSEEQDNITAILNSNDETGFVELCNMGITYAGISLADALFADSKGLMSLPVSGSTDISAVQSELSLRLPS